MLVALLFFGEIMLNYSLKKLQISPKYTISAGSGLLGEPCKFSAPKTRAKTISDAAQ